MRETRYLLLVILITIPILTAIQPAYSVETDSIELDATKLAIATRHDSPVIDLFLSEFVQSDLAANVGITGVDEIAVFIPTTYESFSRAMTSSAFEVSIGWGGDSSLFDRLAEEGAIQAITNQTFITEINNTVPLTIANSRMRSYDDNNDLLWAATSFSSYGFTVNHNELQARGLAVPKTWEDLASPEFFTSVSQPNVGMGNAPDTTSNTRIYQIIIQKYGWDRGWQIIHSMAGNGRVYGGSIETRASVISGETAAALTIDFYGLIAMSENPATEYIIPENGTQIDASPISYSKNPPHKDAADAFIKFVLSQEGQALWLDNRINRMPIREDAFDTSLAQSRDDIDLIHNLYNETLTNEGIQFNETLALSRQETMRYHFEATITNINTKLISTWANLVNDYRAGGMNESRFNEINDYFGRAAINQIEAVEYEYNMTYDAAFRVVKQGEWAATSIDKFDFVIDLISDDNLSTPGDQNTTTEETTTEDTTTEETTTEDTTTEDTATEETTTSDIVSANSSTTLDQPGLEPLSFNFNLIIASLLILPLIGKIRRRH